VGERATVDASGNLYFVGATMAPDSPIVPAHYPCSSDFAGGSTDVVINEVDARGRSVGNVCLGGDGDEQATGVTIDHDGNVLVTGFTTSTNFPSARPLAGSGDRSSWPAERG